MEVNKNTKFDGYYIPNKEILINLAKGKNYYSKFDCKLGFWQIKMDKIFSEYLNFIIVYIDDSLIYFETEEDHEKHLNVFITLYKKYGIILSDKKVDNKKREIKF